MKLKLRIPFAIAATLFMSAVSQAQTVDLNKGLFMHLPMDGNAKDTTIFANHGTIYGSLTPATDETGTLGKALMFDGSSYISVPSNDSLNVEQFSVCAKVCPMGFYPGQYYVNSILTKGYIYWIPGQYALQFDPLFLEVGPHGDVTTAPGRFQDTLNQTFTGYCYGAYPGAKYFDYTPRVKTSKWYTLVLTAESDSIKFYLNGSLMYSFERWGAKGSNINNVRIGMHEDPAYPYSFKGKMSDVRFYTRALNAKEVEAYAKPSGTSIPDISATNKIAGLTLSPNPATTQLNLDFEAEDSSPLVVAIMDMSGRIIRQEKIVSQKGANKTSLAIDELAPAIYTIALMGNNSTQTQAVFIKK